MFRCLALVLEDGLERAAVLIWFLSFCRWRRLLRLRMCVGREPSVRPQRCCFKGTNTTLALIATIIKSFRKPHILLTLLVWNPCVGFTKKFWLLQHFFFSYSCETLSSFIDWCWQNLEEFDLKCAPPPSPPSFLYPSGCRTLWLRTCRCRWPLWLCFIWQMKRCNYLLENKRKHCNPLGITITPNHK